MANAIAVCPRSPYCALNCFCGYTDVSGVVYTPTCIVYRRHQVVQTYFHVIKEHERHAALEVAVGHTEVDQLVLDYVVELVSVYTYVHDAREHAAVVYDPYRSHAYCTYLS